LDDAAQLKPDYGNKNIEQDVLVDSLTQQVTDLNGVTTEQVGQENAELNLNKSDEQVSAGNISAANDTSVDVSEF
jgi:hypothetical protein